MILGLDLSSSCTGFGILDKEGKVVEFGQIKPTAKLTHGQKYCFIVNQVDDIINEYKPEVVVLERYFVGGFKTQGTFICAELRGAIKSFIAEYHTKIKLAEDVFPSTLKKLVSGNGRANKREVCEAILAKLSIDYDAIKGTKKCTFTIGDDKYTDDVSDALSLAYCHWRGY